MKKTTSTKKSLASLKASASGKLDRYSTWSPIEDGIRLQTRFSATLPKQFPGYPLIVHASKLDYRVASRFEGKLVNDQVVALIPGVYTPYNPNVKVLLAYYGTPPTRSD